MKLYGVGRCQYPYQRAAANEGLVAPGAKFASGAYDRENDWCGAPVRSVHERRLVTTLRCVIVDDNADLLRGASRMLDGQGLRVVGTAADCESACTLIADVQPDVVLIDVVLGPESGFDLVKRLASTPETRAPCAILMSTHDPDDFEEMIAESSAIGFVAKSELSGAAIRRLLERLDARPDGQLAEPGEAE